MHTPPWSSYIPNGAVPREIEPAQDMLEWRLLLLFSSSASPTDEQPRPFPSPPNLSIPRHELRDLDRISFCALVELMAFYEASSALSPAQIPVRDLWLKTESDWLWRKAEALSDAKKLKEAVKYASSHVHPHFSVPLWHEQNADQGLSIAIETASKKALMSPCPYARMLLDSGGRALVPLDSIALWASEWGIVAYYHSRLRMARQTLLRKSLGITGPDCLLATELACVRFSNLASLLVLYFQKILRSTVPDRQAPTQALATGQGRMPACYADLSHSFEQMVSALGPIQIGRNGTAVVPLHRSKERPRPFLPPCAQNILEAPFTGGDRPHHHSIMLLTSLQLDCDVPRDRIVHSIQALEQYYPDTAAAARTTQDLYRSKAKHGKLVHRLIETRTKEDQRAIKEGAGPTRKSFKCDTIIGLSLCPMADPLSLLAASLRPSDTRPGHPRSDKQWAKRSPEERCGCALLNETRRGQLTPLRKPLQWIARMAKESEDGPRT